MVATSWFTSAGEQAIRRGTTRQSYIRNIPKGEHAIPESLMEEHVLTRIDAPFYGKHIKIISE